MLIYIYSSIFLSISGMLVFALSRKHLLVMLLSLEFIMVSLYFNILIYLSELSYEYFFSMIFLTMSVCEGALGLAMLVLMIRAHGNDYVLTFSSLW
uniref:NADH-ubiquinone oxidoreductase chain 4L n=2 Tax=Monochamus alternatus TaxID=192382 RepID=A0A0U1V1J0_MONAT|nr:NADH dehydrogenase subunit 4L [Monochamus alternatus]YP_009913601.1 NADH dehydrogenase subunit 4L [Monochamus alternatus alternatus]AIG22816.1 NADH dehydrogenase subunit 4L [Monochamus alternatus]QLM01487.1 NADH dehydrogenase subunit 4L [Monochamus alternatus alternatus]QWM97281.1 NADH dehydrogenase subunit 4L [Monochamus alternatus]